ncbi:hypothetical protein [Rappaport israeli]|uniref:hypothetical protein n=1 Tax=Rappaport israeli TaxID=1839807 RepID=UPI0009314080|nr:hypothetical protein [Rappaport israeli]
MKKQQFVGRAQGIEVVVENAWDFSGTKLLSEEMIWINGALVHHKKLGDKAGSRMYTAKLCFEVEGREVEVVLGVGMAFLRGGMQDFVRRKTYWRESVCLVVRMLKYADEVVVDETKIMMEE